MGCFIQGLPDEYKHFKQKNPLDQSVAIIGALEGHLSNIEDGIILKPQTMQRLLDELKFLCQHFMQDSRGW